jgi:uncharacterized protein (DUF608 family)
MICLEGVGALSHVSLKGKPDMYNEPLIFAALHGEGIGTRVVEGPVPEWKLFFPWGSTQRGSSGNGGGGKDYGLPRYKDATFETRFPFAGVHLPADEQWPIEARLEGWSPFTPPDGDDSSLPVAALEYNFTNRGTRAQRLVFSYNAGNFLATGSGGDAVRSLDGGFALHQAGTDSHPWDEASFAAVVPGEKVPVNTSWFRGSWFDPLTMLWKDLEAGGPTEAAEVTEGDPSPGGSLGVSFLLEAGATHTVRVLLSWYVPHTDLRYGTGLSDEVDPPGTHSPWYAGRFSSIQQVVDFWGQNYDRLREASARFRDCLYDTTLPPAVLESVAANLTILKSPTVLRQTDGRLWCWEGCSDTFGCCAGSCTHVWNYAQAFAHLFPALERTLRTTEFGEAQDGDGRQVFRAPLPIRQAKPEMVPAADGQLGGIVKVYRDWRIGGDESWPRTLWPTVKKSLDYCIELWDPDHTGALVEPHHNTYDIEFWGPDGMCSTIYVAALAAAVAMGEALGENVALYQDLLEKGVRFLEDNLYDGEYFVQEVRWKGLRAGDPAKLKTHAKTGYRSVEALRLLKEEGPKYQYGKGCLSDGVIGAWFAEVSGLALPLDQAKVRSHLDSVFRYNYRETLEGHANPQRPTYALGQEGGLLLGSWPKGGMPSLPFVYSNEVWTGIEYQVASHLMIAGNVQAGLRIVETCRRRYDGRVRNPFDEYECGHWYARALASYSLLQGLSGARYDAVEKVLYLAPRVKGDFRALLATATGYGTVGVKAGKPFLEVVSGEVPFTRIEYTAAGE